MAEQKIKIEIFRNKTVEEFTKVLADPDSRIDTGSAAASVAAVAAALLCRSARLTAASGKERTREEEERVDWLVRNTEILRDYMVKLVDEDVRCRGPLRRALKEGDPQRIEAARQTAVSICNEVIHMMGTGIEMAEELAQLSDCEARQYVREGAELCLAAAKSSLPFILHLASLSPDETYRYVTRREQELGFRQLEERYQSVLSVTSFPVA